MTLTPVEAWAGNTVFAYTDRLALERDIRLFVAIGSDMLDRDPDGLLTLINGRYSHSHVIPGDDVGPAPGSPYATVLLMSDERTQPPIEFDGHYLIDRDTPVILQRTEREARYSVQWYRTNAKRAAGRFISWAESQIALAVSAELGFSFLGIDAIRDIQAIVASREESRFGLDMRIGYWYDAVYDPGYTETSDVTIVHTEIDVALDEGEPLREPITITIAEDTP